MSYTSINGHITKDYPDGDYVYQAGVDSEENRALAEQRLKANGCKTIRFETQTMVQTITKVENANDERFPDKQVTTFEDVPQEMLYAHGYLTERTFVAVQ